MGTVVTMTYAENRDIIRRRFQQGWMNFQTVCSPLVNVWAVYDSSGTAPVLINERETT